MGITIGWDDQVVWLKFVGEWSWEEYDQAIDDVCVILGDTECPINLVFNLLCGPDMPLNYVFSHLQRSLQVLPRNIDLLLIVGASASAKGLLFVFSKTNAKWNPVFVDSLEEARDFMVSWQQIRKWAG